MSEENDRYHLLRNIRDYQQLLYISSINKKRIISMQSQEFDELALGYWDFRCLAERIRFLLNFLNLKYQEVRYHPVLVDQWFKDAKPTLQLKNPAVTLPYLVDNAGSSQKLISQSEAIIVYLAHRQKRLDLLGSTAEEQTDLMTVMGVFKDLYDKFNLFCYGDRPYEEFKQECIDSLKPYWEKLRAILTQKGGQWFCGKSLTYCDIVIGEFEQVYHLFDESFQSNYPELKQHQERVWDLEGIKQYVTSQRFCERPVNHEPVAKWT